MAKSKSRKNLIIDHDSALFSPKYKEMLRKVMLRDERFVAEVLTKYSNFIAEDAAAYSKFLDNVAEKDHKSNHERKKVDASKFLEQITTILFRLGQDSQQNAAIMSQMLEMVCLNCIELKKQLNEITAALAAGEITNDEKMQFSEKLQREEQQFQKAVEQAKEMRILTSWWKRRLDDMKEGDLNERI